MNKKTISLFLKMIRISNLLFTQYISQVRYAICPACMVVTSGILSLNFGTLSWHSSVPNPHTGNRANSRVVPCQTFIFTLVFVNLLLSLLDTFNWLGKYVFVYLYCWTNGGKFKGLNLPEYVFVWEDSWYWPRDGPPYRLLTTRSLSLIAK